MDIGVNSGRNLETEILINFLKNCSKSNSGKEKKISKGEIIEKFYEII
jgi:hypothetical protein